MYKVEKAATNIPNNCQNNLPPPKVPKYFCANPGLPTLLISHSDFTVTKIPNPIPNNPKNIWPINDIELLKILNSKL